MLTFKLDLTTSGGPVSVTTTASVNWIVSDSNIANCSGIITQISTYQLTDVLKYSYNVSIQAPSTTEPAYVRIYGTERVGRTLEPEFPKYNGTRFTTSGAVVYRWYRLDDGSMVRGQTPVKIYRMN